MKKFISKLICAALIFMMVVTPVQAATSTLKDIDVNDPASDKVMWAVEQGYMKPVLGRFFPDKKVNRGEFAYIIWKVTGLKLINPSQQSFTDIGKTYQYYKYIETMKKYINSYKASDGTKTFKPKGYITREDAAMAVVKMLGFDTNEALLDDVESDISIEDFIVDANKITKANLKYVEIAVVNELMDFTMNDNGDIYFNPKNVLTRKELANLLWNATQLRDYYKTDYDEDTDEQDSNENNNNNQNDNAIDSNYDSSEDGAEYPWSRNINVKFQDNPDYIGSWESVAYVNDIESFKPGMQQSFSLFLESLEILPKGYTDKSWLKWTDGHILNIGGDSTNGNLILKEINGEKYLFLQWISGDQLFRGQEPSWYVLKRTK